MEILESKILIIGGGPVGLTCALALAHLGFEVCLLLHKGTNDKTSKSDLRTSALMKGSVELLKNLCVWDKCAAEAQALKSIRLIDDTGNFFRSPEIFFDSKEVGLDAFGYNISNYILVEAISSELAKHSKINIIPISNIPEFQIYDKYIAVTLPDGKKINASLVVAADGRNSPTRDIAGIKQKSWNYPQSALVATFHHERDHKSTSTEFHRLAGPFTVVPMRGKCSSLVWVEKNVVAERLYSLSDTNLKKEIQKNLYGLLGSVLRVGSRSLFPLKGLKPITFAKNRFVLVGEAAHVIPPIGAQGLNLGLRDVACLVDCLCDARKCKNDIGNQNVLSNYSKSRTFDVSSRIFGIDILNGSFLSSNTVPHILRSLTLTAVKSLNPLRHNLMNFGIHPPGTLPKLMMENYQASPS